MQIIRLKMNVNERTSDDESVIDCSDITGTNAYCDAAARDELRRRIALYGADGVHIIGSGNYHYLSLLWMEKIKTDFALVLFDHHTDCQKPAFFGITSCGGWVREALFTLENLKRVYITGPDSLRLKEDMSDGLPIGRIFSGLPPDSEELPVYVSIDTDILSPEYAACDWDQGEMPLFDLLSLISECRMKQRVIGADICGECSDPSDEEYMINLSTRSELCRVLMM